MAYQDMSGGRMKQLIQRRLIQSILSGLLCWAHGAGAQIHVHDSRNVVHTFAAPPQRIISLLPSLTETVCVLGACQRLIGVDQYSNWPSQVNNLPKLGGLEDMQIERIVALNADVILSGRSARVIEHLESLGQRVLVFESQTHEDVQRSLAALATLMGNPDIGRMQWAELQAQIKAASARVPKRLLGKRVYFEVASTPYAAGAASFIGQTLAQLGLDNIVSTQLGPFPKLNPEFVVRAQPYIVMAEAKDLRTMPNRPGWRAMDAISAQRMCGFAQPVYEVLIRPGPRIGEAASLLADCLQRLEKTHEHARQ
jgi:iron complex transport system substrate-binding protein